MWTSGEWASGGDALPMEQELLFGEASPKILLLLHSRVKGSDLLVVVQFELHHYRPVWV